jgi:hypothetical protein
MCITTTACHLYTCVSELTVRGGLEAAANQFTSRQEQQKQKWIAMKLKLINVCCDRFCVRILCQLHSVVDNNLANRDTTTATIESGSFIETFTDTVVNYGVSEKCVCINYANF